MSNKCSCSFHQTNFFSAATLEEARQRQLEVLTQIVNTSRTASPLQSPKVASDRSKFTYNTTANMSDDHQEYLSTTEILDEKGSFEKDQRSTEANSTISHTYNTENDAEPVEKVATTIPQAISRVASASASNTLQRVETRPDGSEYPTGLKLTLITVALCLGVFLMALDNSIIATAIPHITDQFNSLNDVGWYGSCK